jgi:hypothetical protein
MNFREPSTASLHRGDGYEAPGICRRRSSAAQLRFAGSVSMLLAASAGSAFAADLTIDNFTTGAFMSQIYRTGRAPVSSQNIVSKALATRSTGLFVCNPGSCGFA